MVQLFSKSDIASANIDTVERAIVFAATVLRAAIVGENNANNRNTDIRISQLISKAETFLSIQASIKYDSYLANLYGGLILNFINQYNVTNFEVDRLEYVVNVSGNLTEPLPDYDENSIDSFEKFLVYYCFILKSSLPLDSDVISIKQLEEKADGATLELNIKLPFDYGVWLSGDNFIGAVTKTVEGAYSSVRNDLFIIGNNQSSEGQNTNVLTNEVLLTNDILLSN